MQFFNLQNESKKKKDKDSSNQTMKKNIRQGHSRRRNITTKDIKTKEL